MAIKLCNLSRFKITAISRTEELNPLPKYRFELHEDNTMLY
jgi:hypothetical protein